MDAESLRIIKKGLFVCKSISLIFTIAAFLICVIPPTPFTTGEIWCKGTPSKGCYRFMLYPIFLSSAMIFITFAMIITVVLDYSHAVVIVIDGCIVSIACVTWFAINLIIPNHTKQDNLKYFDTRTSQWVSSL